MAFEKEIKQYDDLRSKYQTLVVDRMNKEDTQHDSGGGLH